jgi:hypothetical protein
VFGYVWGLSSGHEGVIFGRFFGVCVLVLTRIGVVFCSFGSTVVQALGGVGV